MNARRRRFLKLFFVMLVLLVPSLTALNGVSAADCAAGTSLSQPTQFLGAGGEAGFINEYFSSLRAAPAGAIIGVVYEPANFETTGAVECVNNHVWVPITYTDGPLAGVSGWALESQTYYDGTYGPGRWLALGTAPTPTPDPAPEACGNLASPYSLPNVLTAGATGKINKVFSTLRPYPGAPDALSQRINNDVTTPPAFTVNETQASGGFCWLNITYTAGPAGVVGQTGWALESQVYPGIYGTGYWLVP